MRLGLARKAQDALGDDVALHLVGAGVDRSGETEGVAVQPPRLDLGLRTQQVEGRLMLRAAACSMAEAQ